MADSHRSGDRLLDVLLAIYALDAPETFWGRLFDGLAALVPFDLAGVGIGRDRSISTALEFPPRSDGISAIAVRGFNESVAADGVLSCVLSPTASAVRVSALLSRRELQRTRLYRDLLQPLGAEDQIMMPLVISRSELVGIGLMRDRQFADRECSILTRLRPHIVQARRNAEAWMRARTPDDSTGPRGLRKFGVVEADLRRRRVVSMDIVADLIIGAAWPRAAHARAALTELFAGIERDRLRLHHSLEPPPPIVVYGANGAIHVHIASTGRADLPTVLIIEGRTPVDHVRVAARLGLTARQAEVLRRMTEGRSNREIATILACSPGTVKKHVENIFERLGVESRTAAAMRWAQTAK